MKHWRPRPSWTAAVLAGLSVSAAAQDTLSPLQFRDLPFARDPSVLQGPARSMGDTSFDQNLPPSDRATQLGGPPRSMGELPPDQTLLPGQQQGAAGLVPLRPGLGFDALRPEFLGGGGLGSGTIIDPSLPNELLIIPGLLDSGGGPLRGSAAAGEPDYVPRPETALPPPPRINDEEALPALSWESVRISSERKYPPFLAILEERRFADGQVLSSFGAFDLGLSADSRNYPLGYYSRTVQDVFLEQNIFNNGGKLFAGYRVGTGTFPSYYLNLQTRYGGAFVTGFEFPLLQNREIDAKRAKVFKAEIERRKVEPTIQKSRISLLKNATKAYWAWVGAGYAYAITQDLVERTDAQFRAVRAQEQAGRVSPIAVVAFQSVLLKRKQQLVQTNRAFQNATINLSLYLRDERGFPILPDRRSLPEAFPPARPPEESKLLEDMAVAINLRPELRSIAFEIQKAQVERAYARNQRLPKANFYVYTEQNVGDYKKNLSGDFRPFIAETSLLFEVPVQRRYARGLEQSANAQIRQLSANRQFAFDEIRAEVLDAFSALRAAYDDLQLYRGNEAVSRQLELAERRSLELGRSNQLLLFVREQTTFDQQVLRVLAEAKYYSALADYRAALGLDAVTPEIERLAPPDVSMATESNAEAQRGQSSRTTDSNSRDEPPPPPSNARDASTPPLGNPGSGSPPADPPSSPSSSSIPPPVQPPGSTAPPATSTLPDALPTNPAPPPAP